MAEDKRHHEDDNDEGKSRLTDKRKQSLYFPEDMLAEIKREALRQDRSLSWIVQQAWRIAREDIKKFPSINTVGDDDEEEM
ncbi:MAG TPA: TIGR04563 family protein [Myxococcota bacterium]|nr:TIGR04563 family protein [Myxococcota bacterium]HRY92594.1 TIGR04563 family protein [Myxococcota bacterium]